MKKTTENKIEKLCSSLSILLNYDEDTDKSYIGKHVLSKATIRAHMSYDSIKKMLKGMSDDDILRAFKEYSTRNKHVDEKKIARQKEKAEYDARTDASKMETWEKLMIRDNKGFIDRTQKRNMYLFFKHKEEFNGAFKYNSFSGIETFKNKLIEDHIIGKLSLVTEQYIENNNESWVESVTNIICHENEYNPIIAALDKLPKWDGKERASTYLVDYIGAEDTKLVRSITIKFFYAMFERLFRPGCRFDHMLITYDETHGTGKSTILITLLEALMEYAGNDFEDSGIIALNDLGFDKDVVQCLNKAWIAYVDELAKFLKEEPEDVKKFITLTTDNARLSYARLNKNFPRHCVFYGSTNTKEFIKDTTDEYERRFWVVDCNGTRHESKCWWDEHLPMETKLQILAEAYEFWKNNRNTFNYNELDDDDIAALKIVQSRHTTASKDNILAEKVMTILDFDYSKDIFENYYQWKNEARSRWDAYQRGDLGDIYPEENDILFKNYEKNTLFSQFSDVKTMKNDDFSHKKLKKIPIVWVKQFIQEELGRMIADDNYINKLISFKWQKNKNCLYTNGLRGCYVRIV